MKFPNLTAMGSAYAAEEGFAGHHRGPVLDSYAASIRTYKVRQAAARAAAAPPSASGSVRDRVNFFNSDLTKRREDAEKEVRDLQQLIDKAGARLARQGGRLLPNGNVDWVYTAKTVVYDHTAAAQGLTQLHFKGGLIYTDALCTQRFDTIGKVTAFGGRGWAIYVMSVSGNIHASSHSVGNRHHSSLLAGATVAGAGEMRVLQGKLMEISNKSGHYAPAAEHFLQVLYALQKRGADLFGTKIAFKTLTAQQTYPSVDAFITDLANQGMETDFEYSKMMAYLAVFPYAQFVAAAALRGWRWGTPLDFQVGSPAAGGRGIVNIADGAQVPHRDVRKWLKSLGQVMPSAVQSGSLR